MESNNNQMQGGFMPQIDSSSNIMYHQNSEQEGVYNYDIPDDQPGHQEGGDSYQYNKYN